MSTILNISGSKVFKEICLIHCIHEKHKRKVPAQCNDSSNTLKHISITLPKNKLILVLYPPCWILPEVGFLKTSYLYHISKSSTKQRFVPNIMIVA